MTDSVLEIRVRKLLGGRDHAERPHSMLRRHLTNVRVMPLDTDDRFEVNAYFLVYRLRQGRYKDLYSGERIDTLRRADSALGWQIARREIVLDESTILGGGIGFLF